ncbi:MAG: hypothetical protein II098_00115 [Treponema sp.]|nr:hypothetical protein [Treponema sp.]
MKKFLFAFVAVFAFLFAACSDNSDSANLNPVAVANVLASSDFSAAPVVANDEKTTVAIELLGSAVDHVELEEGSRSLNSEFEKDALEDANNIDWYLSLDGGLNYSSEKLVRDATTGRYSFEVVAGQEYASIKFKGSYSSNYVTKYCNEDGNEILCTLYYTAEMKNVTFSAAARKNVIKLPYTFDHIEMGEIDGETVDYYNTALSLSYGGTTSTGLVAKVTINDVNFSNYTDVSARLIKTDADGPEKIIEADPLESGDTVTFTFTSSTEIEPGVYNFVLSYNKLYDSYYIGDLLFSDYDSLYLVNNNYVLASYTPVFDKELYTETIYASMDSTADGDGKTYDAPMYIEDAYAYAVSEEIGIKTVYIYCIDDFVLDYDAVYDSTNGLWEKIVENKRIEIIAPKTKYTFRYEDTENRIFDVMGFEVALKGNGNDSYSKFSFNLTCPHDGDSAFGSWGAKSLALKLSDGAAFSLSNYNSDNPWLEKVVIYIAAPEDLSTYSADCPIIERVKTSYSNFKFMASGVYGTKSDAASGSGNSAVSFAGSTSYEIIRDEISSTEGYKLYFAEEN